MNYSYTFNHILTYEEFKEHLQPIFDQKTTYVQFWYPKEDDVKLSMKMCYQVYVDRLGGLNIEFDERVITVRLPHRVAIEKYYQNKLNPPTGQNRMGCSESWYDCYYAITQTLHPNVVDNMTDESLDALVECICAVQEALY